MPAPTDVKQLADPLITDPVTAEDADALARVLLVSPLGTKDQTVDIPELEKMIAERGNNLLGFGQLVEVDGGLTTFSVPENTTISGFVASWLNYPDAATIRQALEINEEGGGGTGVTNLSYTASPTGVTVLSSTGLDATLPAATTNDAGLLLPADKLKLNNITVGSPINLGALTADNVAETAAKKWLTAAEETKLANLASLPVDTNISAFGRTLIDDADQAAARGTLGLGTVATTAAADYATAAQGAKADTISAFGETLVAAASNSAARTVLGLGTAATSTATAFATASQGSLAQTALQPSNIGQSVQAFSSILQNTTASFTVADKVKVDSAANLFTDSAATTNGYITTETDAGLATARTAAVQALIDSQQNGGQVQRFGSGVFRINPGLFLDRQSVIAGEPSVRTQFFVSSGTSGTIFTSRNFAAQVAVDAKWMTQLIGGVQTPTGVTNHIAFQNIAFASGWSVSDDPRIFNQNTNNEVVCIDLWGSGHRFDELYFFNVPGVCIRVEEGGGVRAGLRNFLDVEIVKFRGLRFTKCLSGIEFVAGADGKLIDCDVSNARDYGINIIGHAAAYIDDCHAWGCGIGINVGNGVVNAQLIGKIQGDHDLCGIRLDTTDTPISQVMGKRCKQLNIDIVSRAFIDHADVLIESMLGGGNYTAVGYSPQHKPHPQYTYLAAYTSDPGADGLDGEVSGNGYARQLIARWAIAQGDLWPSNLQEVTFPTATGNWGTITHLGLWSASGAASNLTQKFLGGWALSPTQVINSSDVLEFARNEVTPDFECRSVAEFDGGTAQVDVFNDWKVGGPLGCRIRQPANGSRIDWYRCAGVNKSHYGIGLEVRSTRPKVYGYINNVYDGLILNYSAMKDADIFLIMDNVTNAVRAYANDELHQEESFGTAQTAAGATVTVSDGSPTTNAILTLSTGAWPKRVVGGFVRVGPYTVYCNARNSDTEITVTRNGVNPPNASGVEFCWFRGYNWYDGRHWYATGTVAVSGSTITLSGGVWPPWIVGGSIKIAGSTFTVTGRTNDTVATVSGTPNAGSGQSYEVSNSATATVNVGTPNQLTLTGGVWPEWIIGGTLWIAGTTFQVVARNSDTLITVAVPSGNPNVGAGQSFEVMRTSFGTDMVNNRITIVHTGLTNELIDLTGTGTLARFKHNTHSNKVTFLDANTSHYAGFTTNYTDTMATLTASTATAEDCANAIASLQQQLIRHGVIDGVTAEEPPP